MAEGSRKNDFYKKNYTDWLEETIDSINDGILVIDSQGIVQFVNTEYTNITGVQPEAIVGKPLRDVRKGAILPKALRDGKRRAGIYRREGQIEYVIDTAPVYKHGEIVGAVSVCKSLNEVHFLTKELKRSKERLARLENTVGHMYQTKYTFSDIIGKDSGLKDTVELAKKAAYANLNILIQGESGTGKELFAQAIHSEGPRSKFPFIPVNCAAIPAELLESELFGYEEGSFTSSKKGGKVGLFELSNYGTLFLDEIGDLPFELQAKLLRVLQEGRVRKVGGLNEQEIDVQVITATNKDLGKLVEKKRFREDLYYRLNGVPIKISPLRERKKDILLLINDLIDQAGTTQAIRFTEETRQILSQYDWPGNTRELFNTVHYALSMTETNDIEPQHLPEVICKHGSITNIYSHQSLKEIIKNTEQEVIRQTIKSCGDTLDGKKMAAQQLGISLATLYNKMGK
ncbi:sigma-54 interaction domain-containing protein [Halobacillus amylolyticus]|uniref:Sigma 54-interacting transcriptional regulator n=1 Tax=Halobacillus amylolyticus TaxID=2932259 RepID=A0ABY4HFM2_9BACI|nr:sigma 54-interacting transcriptional regulator [Halobacillus amylolyticus]UOR13706.1 sigma 54-interacting transcriptional regulator [Halobacillus amylolyticus]